MKFIGCRKELDVLEQEYQRDGGFVVLYGRRLYFISDNFMRFWFRYVYPYKGELELDNQQIALDELGKDFVRKFLDFAYEEICKDIFPPYAALAS